MKKALLAIVMLGAANVFAGDLSQIGTLTQSQFRSFSNDLGAASAYKGLLPATP